ncbi:MAG: GDP-mannose 4,6-dehydratase [Myxococcota bacterium]
MKRALITGITGQDGSYLAERLLAEGTAVFGLVRRGSTDGLQRIAHLTEDVTLLDGDLLDAGSLLRAVEESQPSEVYNLAAQSFVGRSWREPVHTAEVTGLGALRMLEAVRFAAPDAHVYQASTSEMYGGTKGRVTASGPFHPRSPYGSAKLFAHASAVNYRESYDMHVSCGILFNHESPRRGGEFVTKKVARSAARIKAGLDQTLALGNLDARRDWGWAPDFVDAMVSMVRAEHPEDYVIGTGVSHSVRDLCEAAFRAVGLEWQEHVVVDQGLLRPADVDVLVGDYSRVEEALGWRPTVTFDEMVSRMVQHEVAVLRGA